MQPALFIHGGAGAKSDPAREKKLRASLREILGLEERPAEKPPDNPAPNSPDKAPE